MCKKPRSNWLTKAEDTSMRQFLVFPTLPRKEGDLHQLVGEGKRDQHVPAPGWVWQVRQLQRSHDHHMT